MNRYDKNSLEKLILIDKLSYAEIGRIYGVCGNSIKKAARKLGIDLPVKRKKNSKETFNKGNTKTKYCLNCGKKLEKYYKGKKFCDNKCQGEFQYSKNIEKWKSGEKEIGIIFPKYLRKYFIEKCGCKCEKCGWHEINEKTGVSPLQIHHIDGDCTNNREDNIQVLCPNCHSLTENYGNLNKNSKRIRNKHNQI